MNKLLGKDKWLQFSPPICREQDGFIDIEGSAKRKAHKRKNMVPKKKCCCEPTNNGKHVASSSPELNLAEFGQGMVRSMLFNEVKCENEVWRGNAKKKMAVVMRVINKLNENKLFFQKLWKGHPKRCQWVLDHDGDISK